MSEMLCEECMKFYRIYEQEGYYYTFSEGICEGCFHRKKVANPNYGIKLHRPLSITAFPATSKYLETSTEKAPIYI